MKKNISGIQQIGIGVPDVHSIWKWYRQFFGTNVRVFEEAAPAPYMTKYTGDKVQDRNSALAISMEGGGGFEIWQYTSRNTEKAKFDIQLGDYGIYSCMIKSRDVQASYNFFVENKAKIVQPLTKKPNGKHTFSVEDPNGNLFTIVDGRGWFKNTGHPSKTGGVSGAIICVSDIEKALPLYRDLLEYETVEYDLTGKFEDLTGFPKGDGAFRRVLLTHKRVNSGPFAQLLGPSEIELIQALDRTDCKKIFEDRYWGDWGYIHLAWDVQGMDALKQECEEKGFPFTVDSGSTFDMGEAGGRFSYVEDPDGTWLEFVETHKVPVLKKLNWYINLKKRDPKKSLPKWMLSAMGLNKVKD